MRLCETCLHNTSTSSQSVSTFESCHLCVAICEHEEQQKGKGVYEEEETIIIENKTS